MCGKTCLDCVEASSCQRREQKGKAWFVVKDEETWLCLFLGCFLCCCRHATDRQTFCCVCLRKAGVGVLIFAVSRKSDRFEFPIDYFSVFVEFDVQSESCDFFCLFDTLSLVTLKHKILNILQLFNR